MKESLVEKIEEISGQTPGVESMYYIDSDTFKPTGLKIGNGCWGQIDLYHDNAGNDWAVKYFYPNETAKKQMRKRGWDEEKVMREEAISIDAAAHNIVPRLIERDKTGKLFVAMPFFNEGDLAKNMYCMNTKKALEIGKDIATALAYYHRHKINFDKENIFGKNTKGKAHGDVKPANILMPRGRLT